MPENMARELSKRPIRKRSGVFKWSEMRVWEPKVRAFMADVLDDAVFAEFHDDPPEFVVGDDLSWIERIIKKAGRARPQNLHSLLTRRLAENYDAVIGFHGCRPVTLDGYKRDGLRICDPEELNAVARDIFGDTPEVSAAIDDLASNDGSSYSYKQHNAGSIYFALSLEHLVDSCGQYLLYGSEYVLCIGAFLRREEELRQHGRATIIECSLPIAVIPPTYLRCLAGEIVEEIFERELDPKYRRLNINFGFPIKQNIPASNIIAFHHPKQIPNHRKYMVLED
jgi:hypothetical protein